MGACQFVGLVRFETLRCSQRDRTQNLPTSQSGIVGPGVLDYFEGGRREGEKARERERERRESIAGEGRAVVSLIVTDSLEVIFCEFSETFQRKASASAPEGGNASPFGMPSTPKTIGKTCGGAQSTRAPGSEELCGSLRSLPCWKKFRLSPTTCGHGSQRKPPGIGPQVLVLGSI